MSKIVKQPADIGPLPRLHDAATARAILRCSHNKWDVLQHELECVRIGHRKFYTDEALLAYVQRQTRKPAASEPKPRRAPARKAVAVARAKQRRHKPGVTVGQRPEGTL